VSTTVVAKLRTALAAIHEALAEAEPVSLVTASNPEAMLSSTELAVRMGVHPRTVQNWRIAGVPCLQLGSRAYRYDLAAVRAWLASRGGK
jgi:hypothetical protein